MVVSWSVSASEDGGATGAGNGCVSVRTRETVAVAAANGWQVVASQSVSTSEAAPQSAGGGCVTVRAAAAVVVVAVEIGRQVCAS